MNAQQPQTIPTATLMLLGPPVPGSWFPDMKEIGTEEFTGTLDLRSRLNRISG